MEIYKSDILSYWKRLYNGVEANELINLLKRTFQVDDIDMIFKMVFNELNLKDEKLKFAEAINDNKDYNGYFFKDEVDSFRNGIEKVVEECNLIKDKKGFIDKQEGYFLDKLDQEAKLFFLNELINFNNEQKNDMDDIDSKIKKFIKERFNTQSFRVQCEAYYPELVRLLKIIVNNQVEFLNEILSNISRDINEIEEVILKRKVEYIDNLILGEGDSHSGGKSVVRIEFDNGKLIYKPRDIGIENKFYEFVQSINLKSNNTICQLDKVKSISKEGYSYCEFIEYKKCEKQDEVMRYYDNLGQLLCLLYALNGTDIHSENIIAQKDMPYIIDIEALFHSQVFINDNVYDEDFKSLLNHSSITVLDIGLLPRKIVKTIDNEDYSMEVGGIGADKIRVSPFKAINLEIDSEGNLGAVKKFVYNKVNENNPIEEFDTENIELITRYLKRGFEKVYSWMCCNKQYVKELVEKIFSGEKTRVILRPTYAYAKLLNISKEPHFLSSYVHRKVLFSKLGLDKSSYSKIVNSEIEQLMQNDIPIFYHYTDNNYLYDYKGNRLKKFSQENAITKALTKIDNMCENDLERELCYIDQAMNLKESNLKADETFVQFSENVEEVQIDKDKYIELADKIGELILRRKVEISNNISWISTSLLGKGEVEFGVGPVGNDFYFGNAGIALYLAYLGKYTGKEIYLHEAKRAVKFNINFLKQEKLYDYGNIGFHNGIGGVILSLALISEIIDIDECEDVIKFSLINLKTLIDKDISYDMLGGSAGLIVSLIELRKIYPQLNDHISELITKAYYHLINSRTKEEGRCYWTSKVAYPYTGYAHGNAGILSAIVKLKNCQKDILGKEIVDDNFINEMLNYQRKLYNAQNRNWQTTHLKELYSNGWCHGAPGILLSRTIMKECNYKDSLIDDEIKKALDTTIKNGFGNNPTYCHGDLGNIEIVKAASLALGNRKLANKCDNTYVELFDSILSNKWDNNIFRNTESLGIMIGLAGWGYSILRFLYEDEIFNFMKM
ncbi:MAG: type 2 lantipeptide synthetase LanM [Clostridium sp.]|nr:type 2 lantipeptide synthetase LanM [Clostridium sp.]